MLNFNHPANNVLDAIETIFNVTCRSSLKTDNLNTCKKEITQLAEFLKCDENQAVIMAIIIESQIESGNFSIKGLLEHVDLKISTALQINELLKPLVENDWIAPEKDPNTYPLTEYSVNTKLLRSVMSGNLQHMEKEIITNSFQLLTKFNKKLKDRNNRKITYEQIIEGTNELILSNSHIDLAAFILQNNMSSLDITLFMYACWQHYSGVENCDYDNIIRDLSPSKEEQYKIRNSFKSGDNFLLANQLLKESVNEHFYGDTTYQLTEKAVYAFDKNAVIKKNHSGNLLKHINPADIQEKKLFFDTNEKKMVSKLHSILRNDNFTQLTDKLASQGMKKGISILLYGQPGTGKTETVLQLGNTSNRFIMMADASKIRSKWVGETEKNMKALFDEYRLAMLDHTTTPVLLFNEADAILGKRRPVNDRGDQMENSMQNILLQELEEFEGIFIATTNLEENLDNAFDRRFLYKIKFKKPGLTTLVEIWKSKFPQIKVPLIKKICAKYPLSGGQIENIRKKMTVDTLLHDKLKVNETYLFELAEQEQILEKKFERNIIGFNK